MTDSELREARFVERGMNGYESLRAIRRASRIKSVAERRRNRRWLFGSVLAGIIAGLILLAVMR